MCAAIPNVLQYVLCCVEMCVCVWCVFWVLCVVLYVLCECVVYVCVCCVCECAV